MAVDYSAFERAYSRKVPPLLKALYENQGLMESAPVKFTFPDKPFVVGIQYFRKIGDINERDVRNHRFAFAVNTDGFDMLVDLTQSELPILQDEYGDVDHIGVSLAELFVASWERLS